jgi:hypothetical protein
MVRPAFLPLVKDARPTRIDALCLVLITFLSAAPYVSRLGFYSDDWAILADFHFKGVGSSLQTFAARPMQGLYLGALYKLFGLDPLGYHIVNTIVIGACVPLIYSLLLRLKIDRRSALATAILFVLLPQLSTVRVWYAAFQIPLSLLFALLSGHAMLSFRESGRTTWLAAAAATAVVSIAAYEIFAPMIFAAALALAWRYPKRNWFGIGLAALLMLAIAAKWLLTSRVPDPSFGKYINGLLQLVRWDYDWRIDYGLNIFAALEVHFWSTLEGWARMAAAPGPLAAAAAAMSVAVLTFWRLQGGGSDQAPPSAARLVVLGLAAFVLGHATFLIAPDIMFSPTGIANRALVAAAIGVAVLIVAAFGLVRRPAVFATVMAVIAFLATCRIDQIAEYWAEAPALQQQVLERAKGDLRALPPNAAIILDGSCPYHGPAILFESSWDVSGALSLALDRKVIGDAVSKRMSIEPHGLSTSIYGERQSYAYEPALYVYDPRRRVVRQLSSEAAAHRYFSDQRRERLICAQGYVGQGSLI